MLTEPLKLRCPKCSAKDYTLTEVVEEHVIYLVRGGNMRLESFDHQPGSILGVVCECDKCGHKWKPRGVRQWPDAIAT